MKTTRTTTAAALAATVALVLAACTDANVGDEQPDETPTPTAEETPDFATRDVTDGRTTFVVVENADGAPTLAYSPDSAFSILSVEVDGVPYAFKDMNGNGSLDLWEDWRETPEDRAADLAATMSIEQIAGLMLFSPSEYTPGDGLTDPQKEYLKEDQLRLVLNNGSNNVEDNVTWTNEMQAFVESLASEGSPYVPVNMSTDPRSDASGGYMGTGTADISMWPGNLGLAATFDPETARQFGQMASLEYRALGLTNVLSPQVDVASDPRWLRDNGTFGEDPELSAAMAAAFIEGFQNTYDEDGTPLGWGSDSVSAVIKHFAGDSAGESGRASYLDSGKYAVFPGGNHAEHLTPFESGIDAAGVMTTYSILLDGEGQPLIGDRVAGAFNKELVDILRVDHDYDGVIMTDWGVTAGGPADPDATWFTNWGVENLTVEERHFLVLKAGIDMFGGNFDAEPVLAAYEMWQEEFEAGELETDADTRFAESAERILKVIFLSGLYENPYVDLEESLTIANSEDKVAAGFEAQLNSVVVLKNAEATITCSPEATSESPYADATVYIPRYFDVNTDDLFDDGSYAESMTVNQEIAEQYFGTVVTDEVELDDNGRVVSYTAPDLTDVDVVLVGMHSPNNGYGFNPTAGMDPLTGEYYPISLQYGPYTADGPNVRQVSISGNLLEDGSQENRTYFGVTSRITNASNLDAFERAVTAVEASGKDIPILTMLRAKNPIIPAEFEARSDAITVGFDVSENAQIEILLGMHESNGRLPMTFPANMDTVEANFEDVPHDLDPYVDSAGNSYGFGYGLNCAGEPIE